MLWPKKADRAGLHAGGAAWALGLVRGRGRPLPSRAASRCVVAAARPTGNPAARIHPGRHNQDPDLVPSRIRPGAAAASPPLHQCGPAPVAARAPERDTVSRWTVISSWSCLTPGSSAVMTMPSFLVGVDVDGWEAGARGGYALEEAVALVLEAARIAQGAARRRACS